MKNIYLFVGKSGSGKTSIVEELEERFGYNSIPSFTSRPKRYEGETGHIFISQELASSIYQNCKDSVMAYNNINGYHYFVTTNQIEAYDLYVIDPSGIKYLREHYKGSKGIKTIGIRVPTYVGEARMRKRGDSDEAIRKRLSNDFEEFDGYEDIVDIMVENDNLEDSIDVIRNFIQECENESELEIDIEVLTPDKVVLDRARTTVWKNEAENEPSEKFMRKMYMCEHSPIRDKMYVVKIRNVKSWIATHLVRHSIGVTPYVSTQRSDRINVDRDNLPQGALVNIDLTLNAQAFINISRKRLCGTAHYETREVWQEVVRMLEMVDPILFDYCVPNCMYRGGFCPEGKNSCKLNQNPYFLQELEKYTNNFEKTLDN